MSCSDRRIRQVGDRLFLSGRVDAYAFALGQLAQQLQTFLGRGGDERGAREIDDARDLLRDRTRARLATGNIDDEDPRGQADEQQQRNQQKVRQSSDPGSRCSSLRRFVFALLAIRHEHVSETPDRLDIGRACSVGLDQAAQPEICTSIERSKASNSRPRASSISLSRDRGVRGCVARTLSKRELAGRQGTSSLPCMSVRVPRSRIEAPKLMTGFALFRSSGRAVRLASAQHGMDARHQLAGIEGLRQVVVRRPSPARRCDRPRRPWRSA
jgi:hypothetical protein